MLKNRDVAQLVARYVRDVEVAGSSLVIPTEKRIIPLVLFFFIYLNQF